MSWPAAYRPGLGSAKVLGSQNRTAATAAGRVIAPAAAPVPPGPQAPAETPPFPPLPPGYNGDPARYYALLVPLVLDGKAGWAFPPDRLPDLLPYKPREGLTGVTVLPPLPPGFTGNPLNYYDGMIGYTGPDGIMRYGYARFDGGVPLPPASGLPQSIAPSRSGSAGGGGVSSGGAPSRGPRGGRGRSGTNPTPGKGGKGKRARAQRAAAAAAQPPAAPRPFPGLPRPVRGLIPRIWWPLGILWTLWEIYDWWPAMGGGETLGAWTTVRSCGFPGGLSSTSTGHSSCYTTTFTTDGFPGAHNTDSRNLWTWEELERYPGASGLTHVKVRAAAQYTRPRGSSFYPVPGKGGFIPYPDDQPLPSPRRVYDPFIAPPGSPAAPPLVPPVRGLPDKHRPALPDRSPTERPHRGNDLPPAPPEPAPAEDLFPIPGGPGRLPQVQEPGWVGQPVAPPATPTRQPTRLPRPRRPELPERPPAAPAEVPPPVPLVHVHPTPPGHTAPTIEVVVPPIIAPGVPARPGVGVVVDPRAPPINGPRTAFPPASRLATRAGSPGRSDPSERGRQGDRRPAPQTGRDGRLPPVVPHRMRPPRKGEKERKAKLVQGIRRLVIHRGVNPVTEALELLDCAWKALPKDVRWKVVKADWDRQRATGAVPRPKDAVDTSNAPKIDIGSGQSISLPGAPGFTRGPRYADPDARYIQPPSPSLKAATVYEHALELDLGQFIACAAADQAEDRVIGLLNQAVVKGWRDRMPSRLSTPTTGPTF